MIKDAPSPRADSYRLRVLFIRQRMQEATALPRGTTAQGRTDPFVAAERGVLAHLERLVCASSTRPEVETQHDACGCGGSPDRLFSPCDEKHHRESERPGSRGQDSCPSADAASSRYQYLGGGRVPQVLVESGLLPRVLQIRAMCSFLGRLSLLSLSRLTLSDGFVGARTGLQPKVQNAFRGVCRRVPCVSSHLPCKEVVIVGVPDSKAHRDRSCCDGPHNLFVVESPKSKPIPTTTKDDDRIGSVVLLELCDDGGRRVWALRHDVAVGEADARVVETCNGSFEVFQAGTADGRQDQNPTSVLERLEAPLTFRGQHPLLLELSPNFATLGMKRTEPSGLDANGARSESDGHELPAKGWYALETTYRSGSECGRRGTKQAHSENSHLTLGVLSGDANEGEAIPPIDADHFGLVEAQLLRGSQQTLQLLTKLRKVHPPMVTRSIDTTVTRLVPGSNGQAQPEVVLRRVRSEPRRFVVVGASQRRCRRRSRRSR